MGYIGRAGSLNSEESGLRPVQSKQILDAGWKPLAKEFDLSFFMETAFSDPLTMLNKALDAAGAVANVLGRNNQAWWSNAVNAFGNETRWALENLWDYITPPAPGPDENYQMALFSDVPIRENPEPGQPAIQHAIARLQERIVLKALKILGTPDLIIQEYGMKTYELPLERFKDWNLEHPGTVMAYWQKEDVWLRIQRNFSKPHRTFCLIGRNLQPLVSKAAMDLALIVSGFSSRVGTVAAQYPLSSFSRDVQQLSGQLQDAVMKQAQVAALAVGEPGTGKTAWTQAFAFEVLKPLGYTVFILDHDSVENFVPPSYLSRVAIIVNEADNLAQNRADIKTGNKTERILGLLDGTLHQAVIESRSQQSQKLVILMTCNTTDRLDPAMLRKGRVDFIHTFDTRYV